MNKKQITIRKQKLTTPILFLPFLLVRIRFKLENRIIVTKRTDTQDR